MQIVVVEDEVRIREGIVKLLGKLHEQYEVVGVAGNGAGGLALVREHRPELVITDIRMEPMDGLEMLSRIYEEGIKTKAIVISAYSEFEYARSAMKMGVTEYLVKPITLNAIAQAMENIGHQLRQESGKSPKRFGEKEYLLREILAGGLEADQELCGAMEEQHGIGADTPLIIVCAYLGSEYEPGIKKMRRRMELLWKERQELSFCLMEMEFQRSLVSVLYRYESEQAVRRWFQLRLMNEPEMSAGFVWTQAPALSELKSSYEKMFAYLDWNIALKEEVVIAYPQICDVQTVPCVYPVELENRMKAAVCADNWKQIRKYAEEFGENFRSGKVYEPKEIKECYVRFLWAVIGIAKEVGGLDYTNLEQAHLLDKIMSAKRNRELDEAMEELLGYLKEEDADEGSVHHLAVRRAKGMIHEYYQTGITLEEIAGRLGITPEYLGTQFHREVGVTFSAYMRSYRMDRAKELLCRTQLKLYQIAEKVGYSNPKYFSQVFKEYTGQLPAEYRKMYR